MGDRDRYSPSQGPPPRRGRAVADAWASLARTSRGGVEVPPAGPGGLRRAALFLRCAELDMHPLDTHDRRELAQGAAGLGMCNITECCTEGCSENIKITDNAIIPMKERVVDKKYDPLVWLGSKIGLRNKDDQGRAEV